MKAELFSSFDIPPPDYDSAVGLEDNPIYESGPSGLSNGQLPQTSNINASMIPQNMAANAREYRSHFSHAPIALNRAASLPGDQVSVRNPLFQLDDQPNGMPIDYGRVGRQNEALVHPDLRIHSLNRSVSDYPGRYVDSSPSTAGAAMNYYRPSYDEVMDMEKYELKQMFNN